MKNPFSKSYTTDELQQFLFLRNFDLFQDLTDRELQVFLPHMFDRTYINEEVVFFRNDPSLALYLIKKGKIQLNLDINEKFEELAEVGLNSMLGENCLIENTKRPMNAVVVSETAHICVIPKDNIMSIFEGNEDIKAKMMEAFARINETYLKQVFKHYRSSFGLFSLSDVFKS